MGIMSGANGLQSKPTKKYVLQQSNCNLDVSHGKEDQKFAERNVFVLKNKEGMFETENQCSPQKKSEAKKLRSIRLELSSLKRGVIQKANLKALNELSSDESSEDEAKKKRKPRPVVPNYVTNSDSGPCRKPRQSRQDSMVLSSQNSPKLAKLQPLSIARRNARERNRVKQVNEGFATLRSRIPEYISEAYNEEKGRKSAKKLSKVETLRMAVDYIRHLETLLGLKSIEKETWPKPRKSETQPWDTPSPSTEYPSPVESKYLPVCADSPGTSYDQNFEYQDRIFYDYDLDFIRKDEKRPPTFGVLPLSANDNENQCVDDFKYYETFNRLKKENGEHANDENVAEEEELEDLDRGSDLLLPKVKDAMRKAGRKTTVLPPITESFGKGIPVFF